MQVVFRARRWCVKLRRESEENEMYNSDKDNGGEAG